MATAPTSARSHNSGRNSWNLRVARRLARAEGIPADVSKAPPSTPLPGLMAPKRDLGP